MRFSNHCSVSSRASCSPRRTCSACARVCVYVCVCVCAHAYDCILRCVCGGDARVKHHAFIGWVSARGHATPEVCSGKIL